MITKAILESHPVSVLKKEIRKSNIKKYSGLKKAEIIEIMLSDENKGRFDHIEMAKKREKLPSTKKQVEFLEKLEEEDRKKAAKLPDRKGEKKAAKVTTFGPTKPPRGKKKETHKMPDGTVMTGKTHSKDSKPVKKIVKVTTFGPTKPPRGKSKAFKKVVKELDEKGKVYRKARKEFGKDDPLRSGEKKARKPRKLTAKTREKEEEKLEKAHQKAMEKRGQKGFDKDEVDRILNEGYKELKKKYKKI